MNIPIGSILTVPKNFIDKEYIDYVENLNVGNQYPRLANSLGSDYLPSLNSIPVGDIKFGLIGNNICFNSSYVEWNKVGNLCNYPELKKFLIIFYQSLELNSPSRCTWENAIKLDVLPDINSLFFRIGYQGGLFDLGANSISYHYPVIQFTDNLLIHTGRSAVKPSSELYNSVSSKDISESTIPANLVLLGQKPSNFDLKENPTLIQMGTNAVGYPAHMTVQVFINTRTVFPNVPVTHKLVIKVG